MPTTITQIDAINSTSFADVAGLGAGLSRLPQESATDFLERVQRAGRMSRSVDYESVVNEISLQLGLSTDEGIAVTSEDTQASITVDLSGVYVVSGSNTYSYPLVEVSPEGVWEWRMLAQISDFLNSLPGFTASLLVVNGPACQLCRFSNTYLVAGEAVDHSRVQLAHQNLVPGSLQFSTVVSDYTLDPSSGLLQLPSIPNGLQVTYQWRAWPCSLIVSQSGLISLTDPLLSMVGIDQYGAPVHQLQEAVQDIVSRDHSYWAR